jgi:hypothetical protein
MLSVFLSLFFLIHAQDVPLTPEMYEYSPKSITGVYVCTPMHVKNGDCRDVDAAYYESLAVINLGIYEIGFLEAKGRKTLAFKGPLSPGSADNLIRFINQFPEVDTIVLSSQGGSEEEAYKIADIIRLRKLKTWVPPQRMCLSACSVIFLSGSEMILDGLLGLHSGTFYIADMYLLKDMESAQKTINKATYESEFFLMKRVHLFNELALSLDIIDAMVAAKGEFLFFKSVDELYSFDKNKNYILPIEKALEYTKSQDIKKFEFKSYKQLF